MARFKRPGIGTRFKRPSFKIRRVVSLPPSVAAVETAIPAFIGFTQKARNDKGESLSKVPTKVTSLHEYQAYFGTCPKTTIKLDVSQTKLAATGNITDTKVVFSGSKPSVPDYMLYYSMQLFFANGGGACYIMSIGDTSACDYNKADFINAFKILEQFDEPTLYVFPDACSHRPSHIANDSDVGDIVDAALSSCAKMQDRFTIADVRNAVAGGTDTATAVTTAFREKILLDPDIIKYGAAYFPFLDTSVNFLTDDTSVYISSHTLTIIATDGSSSKAAGSIAADTAINDSSVMGNQIEVYNASKAFVRSNANVTLPPSGAIAGIYARVDSSRGVHKSPANVGLTMVEKPAVVINNAMNEGLNVDATSGKSVNAIREFAGRGCLVWGARTLAGNDNEWRYIAVRRFFNFVQESVKKATTGFASQTNDAHTWTRVEAMIANFLTLQWRAGALLGATPEEAFFVSVGLNKTMSANDVLNGVMIIEIGMAVLRPAEFIVYRFSVKMQK
jgi:hypothetical protein